MSDIGLTLDSGHVVIDVRCTHCGIRLAVKKKPGPHHFVIAGLYPMDVVHATGERTCTRTFTARPYDEWDLERALDRALESHHTGVLPVEDENGHDG